MIFPDLPRPHRQWTPAPIELEPLPSVPAIEIQTSGDRAEQWLAQHFPDQSAVNFQVSTMPTFDQDPWGYIKLFLFVAGMAAWAAFWHQYQ